MLILVLVFVTVFVVVVSLLYAITMGSSKEVKQTLARLDAISLSRGVNPDAEPVDVRRQELLSTLPWLNRLLESFTLTAQLRLLLRQANLTGWTVGRVVSMSLVAGVAAGYLVYLRTGAGFLGFLVAVGAGSTPFMFILSRRSARFDKFAQGLPEALDLMVAAIRAGHSFNSAMGMAAQESPEPIKGEFRQCFDEQNFGLDLRTAMSNLAARVPTQDVRIIVTAVLIQRDTGGNLTEILDKVAYLIRERFRLQRQIRVHTAQGRMTGWILSILPVALGFALYMINPDQMSILWKRPVGLKMLYGAVCMIIIGGLIIRKIVRLRI
jgi:tight adherence protein B